MTMRVLSFDFDGCLFNRSYIDSDDKNIIKYNQAFLDRIKEDNKGFDKAITFIGSNRQSKAIDAMNSFLKGSCFPAAKVVNDYLDFPTLDTLLLADIYGDLPNGTSYTRAMDTNYTETHSYWLFDESKATILYAQMHKVAQENPDEQIEYDFYDDRSDILILLQPQFGVSTLINNHVLLFLEQFKGREI